MSEVLTGRDELERLSETGRYVFHGSSTPDIKEFIPKPVESKAEHNGKPIDYDGKKYIFATRFVDVAIFVAVVFRRRGTSGWYTSEEGGKVTFEFNASEEAKREAANSTGYVYVLPGDNFFPSRATSHELVSSHSVKPTYVVQVDVNDLNPPLHTLKDDIRVHDR